MGKVRYKELSPQFEKLSKRNDSIELKSNIRGGNVAEVLQISTNKINPYERQARKRFDEKDIEGLEASIKEVGIISPLLVIKSSEIGYFKVINGERRLRAATKSGLEKVPCIILENEDRSDLIALIDNVQRVDLHPIEFARACGELLKNSGRGDMSAMAEKIGVASSHISESLKLLSLPEEIQQACLDGNVRTRAFLRRLIKCKTKDEMKKILGLSDYPKKDKARNLVTFFIADGKVGTRLISKKLTEKQKEDLKKAMESILSDLSN
jgi:ParB family chromosome partitioning protein